MQEAEERLNFRLPKVVMAALTNSQNSLNCQRAQTLQPRLLKAELKSACQMTFEFFESATHFLDRLQAGACQGKTWLDFRLADKLEKG